MKEISEEFGVYIDWERLLGEIHQAVRELDGSFALGKSFDSPRHRAFNGNLIARNGWRRSRSSLTCRPSTRSSA